MVDRGHHRCGNRPRRVIRPAGHPCLPSRCPAASGKKQGAMPLFGDASDLFMADSSAQTEIEIARSRMVLTQAIEQVQANVQVRPQPRSLKERWLPGLFADSNRLPFAGWSDGEATLWVDELLVPSTYLDTPLTLTVTGPNSYTLHH